MVDVRYVPAVGAEPWRVALAPDTVVALPPNVSIPTVEAVWRRLGERGIGAVIEALTGAFGTSLAAIPDFVLAIAEPEGLRVAVRGPIELIVETDDGAQAVSGVGVATWAERNIPGARRVSAAFAASADESLALPVVEGIVAADAVSMNLAPGRSPLRPVAAPAAAVVPVAESVAVPAPEPEPEPQPDPVAVPAPEPEPVAVRTPEPEPVAELEPVAQPESAAEPESAAAGSAEHDESALPIPAPAETVVDVAETAAAAPESLDDDSAMLWGETIVSPVRGAESQSDATAGSAPAASVVDDATIVSPSPAIVPQPSAPQPSVPQPVVGDHDGETIAVADIRGIRRPDAAAFESTEIVPARQLQRGRIRVSDGQVVELENTVIIGRRPRSPRAAGDSLPTLIAVESPEQDISRNHVEIRAEGEHVLAVDLDTTNGTVLLRGGHDPVRLHPNEPTMIVSGDVLDIGDGITIAFEDLP